MKNRQTECPLFGKCGACQTLNLDYEEELSLKMKREITLLKRFGHIEEILPTPGGEDGERPLGFRNKAQYLFQYNGGRVNMGFYRSSDGGLTRTDRCPMEASELASVARTVRKMIEPYGLKVWDGRRGILRHVMIRKGFATGEVLCAVVTKGGLFEGAEKFAAELAGRHPALKSVSVIANDTDTALLMNGEEYVLHGPGFITDELCGCRFRISAKAFYQVNPRATELLYGKAAEYAEIGPKDRVLDAYCGIGTVGITAAKGGCGSLTGFDVSADAIRDAEKNARENGIGNASFKVSKDGSFSPEEADGGTDVLFLDPPRAGCDRRFLGSVLKAGIGKVIYISCNPETLARDLAVLREGYRVRGIQPVDMFPGTGHVETVVLMSRKDT